MLYLGTGTKMRWSGHGASFREEVMPRDPLVTRKIYRWVRRKINKQKKDKAHP